MDIPDIIPLDKIAAFCQKWRITEIAVFGSVLGADFNENSDIDFLITFSPETRIGLLDLAQAQLELGDLVGRDVDLVERAAIRNPFRKKSILGNMKVLYAA